MAKCLRRSACAAPSLAVPVAPATRAHLRRLARRANKKGARDATKYGETRLSTRSFYTHHLQRMSKAAVLFDAINIRAQVGVAKQQACGA